MHRRRQGAERDDLTDHADLTAQRRTSEQVGTHDAREATALLSRAADTWARRGYELQYADAQLVQLAAPVRGLTSRQLLLALGVGTLAGIAGALGLLTYLHLTRHGRWHVVSLLLTPERRVLTHERWQPIPSQP
jgi:hypothetical protein